MTKKCDECGYEDKNNSYLEGEDCPRCLETRCEWMSETGVFYGDVGTLITEPKLRHLRIVK